MSSAPALTLQAKAERSVGQLPGLLLAAEAIAERVQTGGHGRKRAGPGDTFWQFRAHTSGEPSNQIDWRQSAKRDSLTVREREWVAAQTCLLWVDQSPSMAFSSEKKQPTKQDNANLLALSLATLLVRGEEFVGSLDRKIKPGSSKQTLEALAYWLTQAPQTASASGELVGQMAGIPTEGVETRRSTVVWFGDFLDDIDALKRRIGVSAAANAKGLLVQVLDPAESDLPYKGRVRFEGLEGEGQWTIQRTQDVREDYLSRFSAHQQQLEDCVQAVGWQLLTLGSHIRPPENLAQIYQALEQK